GDAPAAHRAREARAQRQRAGIEMTIAEALSEHASARGVKPARRPRDVRVLRVRRIVRRIRELELIHADARVLVQQAAARTAHQRVPAGHTEREITLLEERGRRFFTAERTRDLLERQHVSYYTSAGC